MSWQAANHLEICLQTIVEYFNYLITAQLTPGVLHLIFCGNVSSVADVGTMGSVIVQSWEDGSSFVDTIPENFTDW